MRDMFSTTPPKPMGVANYKTTTNMPEELRRALPDIEELKKLLMVFGHSYNLCYL